MQVCSQQILCFFALDMSLHKQFFLLYYIVPEFLARCVMIFPLEQLIKFKDNIYEIIILKPFEHWYKTPKRTKIAFGGRGGGKSESIARMLVAKSFETKGVILCARETQKSLEDSIKKVLEEIIIDEHLEHYFRFTRTEIENKNTNCRFLFRGLRDSSVESIKSIKGVKICFVEEAQFLSEHSFKILKPSIRAEESEIWYAFNPRFPQDVIYNLIRVYNLKDDNYEAEKD